MPKKFYGENTKAIAARARKEAAKRDEAAKKKKAEEDAYWQDDDKNIIRKQRKEEAERKRTEALQRKHENRLAHDEEMKALSGKAARPSKITQTAIEANKRAEEERRREEERERMLKEQRLEAKEEEIEENVNQLEIEGETARTVTEAINILSISKPTIDRHPEKRVKAAYQEFEKKMLPRLREEYPTYRLSQLKQICFIMVKVWLAESGSDCILRSFSLEKYVKEILDDFVSDPERRSKCCLVFLGKVLAEDVRLSDVRNMEDKYTLHVMECREKFQFLRASKRGREKIIDEMSKDDFVEGLLKEFPLLKKDRMALIVAKDFILSGAMIIGKQNTEEAFLQDHPILVDVIHYWLRGITVPPKMSHSGSSASISDNPTPSSGQSGYAPIVTPQMLQEAVAQAMRNVGGGGTNQGLSSSSTSSSRNSHHFPGTLSTSGSTQYTSQLAQLADFGFINTEENRRILEETGGNVEQALELLIALRESVMGLGNN
ncbi:hypothetical protein ACH3XW_13545 [Acanthocheilonema viteae]